MEKNSFIQSKPVMARRILPSPRISQKIKDMARRNLLHLKQAAMARKKFLYLG
jgi:hypothetical protein